MTAFQLAQLATQLLIAALGAWLAAILAARFTLNRFYKERIWERKAAAYTAILEALHDMLEWYSQNMEAESRGKELSDERSKQLSAASNEAERVMRRRLAAETWLLSSKLNEIIDAMNKKFYERQESWFEHLDAGYGVVQQASREVRDYARSDLRVSDGKKQHRQ